MIAVLQTEFTHIVSLSEVRCLLSTVSAADFVMGVYLMLIGTSDVIYRDQYNRYALSWMDSWCCQSAGFLAVLSCEVYYAYLLTYLLTYATARCPRDTAPTSEKETSSAAEDL